MSAKPTLFMVTDIETTLKRRIAFDVAWSTIDRKGRVYGGGSYVIREAFSLDVPYFKEKLGYYFDDAYNHLITPASMDEVRDIFNLEAEKHRQNGHRVVFAAYNTAFDAKYLGETSQLLLDKPFMRTPLELVDIWAEWCKSAPQAYDTKTAKNNPRTSAEAVYAYEFCKPGFVERHMAIHDVNIETEILLKVLRRKKELHIVPSVDKLISQPWRLLKSYPAFRPEPALAA